MASWWHMAQSGQASWYRMPCCVCQVAKEINLHILLKLSHRNSASNLFEKIKQCSWMCCFKRIFNSAIYLHGIFSIRTELDNSVHWTVHARVASRICGSLRFKRNLSDYVNVFMKHDVYTDTFCSHWVNFKTLQK